MVSVSGSWAVVGVNALLCSYLLPSEQSVSPVRDAGFRLQMIVFGA